MTQIISDPLILNNKEWNFVDMHHHSVFSDGTKTPETLAKIFRRKGVGLCIADHNQIKGAVYLAKQKDVFNIPAIEVTSKEAKDVLGYFYSIRDLESFWENEVKMRIRNNALFNLNRTTLSVHEIIDKIKKYNGVSVLAHPFTLRPKDSHHLLRDREFMRRVDGIELFNLGEATKRQIKTLVNLEKPMTAGTDSHTISSFNTLTGSKEFEVDRFLDSILKRKNIFFNQREKQIDNIIHKLVIFKKNFNFRKP